MATMDWKKICCPIDFSDTSRAAMEAAAELAKRSSAELVLLHAYPIPGFTFPDGSFMASPRMMQELADRAQASLKEWRADASTLGVEKVETVSAVGDPPQEIVSFALSNNVDLIVIGTHGRTGIEHALMGSVAERVVRRASCPVLTIRKGTEKRKS